MTNEQAKSILLRYRSGTPREPDLELEEALKLAQSNPELRRWLEQQEAWNAGFRRAFRSIPVPVPFKRSVRKTLPVTVPLRRRPEFLLLAAVLAGLLIVTVLWTGLPREDETVEGFRTRMARFALREYRMDIVSADPAEVRIHLRREGAPWEFPLPPALEPLPVKGGARLSWQGHPVAMICFDLPEEEILYMFVLDQQAFRGRRLPEQPQLAQFHTFGTALFSQEGQVYLLAAPLDQEQLGKLVSEPRS